MKPCVAQAVSCAVALSALSCADDNVHDRGRYTPVSGCGDSFVNYIERFDGRNVLSGDSFVNYFERCDDGNVLSGDGCSGRCAIEHAFACWGEPSVCLSTCGDGLRASDEACDDGNTDDCVGDCSADCSAAVAVTGCGDGIVCGTEACDDGRESATCDDDCTAVACGDGLTNAAAGESCDDGNVLSGDGCSPTCQAGARAIAAGYRYTCAIRSDHSVACWRGWAGEWDGASTPPAGTFKVISAGGYHTCGILSDDSVACWGNNDDGQSTPPAGSFKAIAAGQWRLLALSGLSPRGDTTPAAS
jgi:cysteine-rich repeat protein